jgi:isocitrate/isopropylmalate dehydrogenase
VNGNGQEFPVTVAYGDGIGPEIMESVLRIMEAAGARLRWDVVEIGSARLAAQPEQFDVIVTLNLYGDILSDIAAQVAGYDVIKTEHLYTFDGVRGYSLGQGE